MTRTKFVPKKFNNLGPRINTDKEDQEVRLPLPEKLRWERMQREKMREAIRKTCSNISSSVKNAPLPVEEEEQDTTKEPFYKPPKPLGKPPGRKLTVLQ
jgi:hypothetical protein